MRISEVAARSGVPATTLRYYDTIGLIGAHRLREVDEHLAALQRLRNQLDSANQRVTACPDSGAACRSECILLDDRHQPCTSRDAHEGDPRL